MTDRRLAKRFRTSCGKVDRVKKRFVEAALGGRQGRRETYLRKADGDFEAHLLALTCEEPLPGHGNWSLRLLADRAVELGYIDSVPHETVWRVLKKSEIKPWRQVVERVIPPRRN